MRKKGPIFNREELLLTSDPWGERGIHTIVKGEKGRPGEKNYRSKGEEGTSKTHENHKESGFFAKGNLVGRKCRKWEEDAGGDQKEESPSG